MKKLFVTVLIIMTIIENLFAQVSKDSDLFRSLKTQDSIFFERGFNQCDITYLENAVHPELTFYHDQGGMQNREVFLQRVKQNLCADANKKPIRKVDEASLEVFPLYENKILYGVIQTGRHNFYLREPGKMDVLTSKAKFIHLYLLVNGKWLLKEVLSFDHQAEK
ncbi:MAG TPA: nuclear transport factor 2 family protein [Chitinophagaceae bacterium]